MKLSHIILHIVELKAIFSCCFCIPNVCHTCSVTNCFPISEARKKHSFEMAKISVQEKSHSTVENGRISKMQLPSIHFKHNPFAIKQSL